MHLCISSDTLPTLKRRLREYLPSTKSSLRMEALARGCGFRTFGGLIKSLENEPIRPIVDEKAFLTFLNDPTVVGGRKDRPLSHAIARAWLDTILDRHPTLTERGLDSIWRGGWEEKGKSRGERIELLAKRRKQAYASAGAVDGFELALLFLSRQERIKSPQKAMDSYGIKHRAENLSRQFGLFTHLGNYVSNGMLLAAAYASGFTVVPDGAESLNASLNVSMRTINLSRGMNRRNRHGDPYLDADPQLVHGLYDHRAADAV